MALRCDIAKERESERVRGERKKESALCRWKALISFLWHVLKWWLPAVCLDAGQASEAPKYGPAEQKVSLVFVAPATKSMRDPPCTQITHDCTHPHTWMQTTHTHTAHTHIHTHTTLSQRYKQLNHKHLYIHMHTWLKHTQTHTLAHTSSL